MSTMSRLIGVILCLLLSVDAYKRTATSRYGSKFQSEHFRDAILQDLPAEQSIGSDDQLTYINPNDSLFSSQNGLKGIESHRASLLQHPCHHEPTEHYFQHQDHQPNVHKIRSNQATESQPESFKSSSINIKKGIVSFFMSLSLLLPGMGSLPSYADDELAKYAAEGNSVAVDGECFIKKCALETSKCANDPNCLKGLSCLARCKGGSMCSTGCFSKYGSDRLDGLLYCSVEKHDCVQVPGKGDNTGWVADSKNTLPTSPMTDYDISNLQGTWYKVMGLDSRYDCFDCQRNSFQQDKDSKDLKMEALFRIPRPTNPGYLQSKISETLMPAKKIDTAGKFDVVQPNLQSTGTMFGLSFWENWYLLGESKVGLPPPQDQIGISSAYADVGNVIENRGFTDDLKLVFYTGHTLQGSYKGAFVYSTSPQMSKQAAKAAARLIFKSGLNPNDFCTIRNTCFVKDEAATKAAKRQFIAAIGPAVPKPMVKVQDGGNDSPVSRLQIHRDIYKLADGGTTDNSNNNNKNRNTPFWFLGQKFFQTTQQIADELNDWLGDPEELSEWLTDQQQHDIFTKPFTVSPFASLEPFDTYADTSRDAEEKREGDPVVPGNTMAESELLLKKSNAALKNAIETSEASANTYKRSKQRTGSKKVQKVAEMQRVVEY